MALLPLVVLKDMMENAKNAMSGTTRSATWGATVLAGLPHLLFVSVAASPYLVYSKSTRDSWNVPLLMFSALIVLVLITAWRQRWPRWAASWIGYGLVVAQLVPFGLDEGYTVMGWLDSQMSTDLSNLFFGVRVIFSLGVGLLLAGRDRPSGLLVTLPVVTMMGALLALDSVPSGIKIPILVSTGLITALAAAALVRLERVRNGLSAALAANLAVVLITWAYSYHSFHPSGSTAWTVVSGFVFRLVSSAVALTGPLWGWELWEPVQRLLTQKAETANNP